MLITSFSLILLLSISTIFFNPFSKTNPNKPPSLPKGQTYEIALTENGFSPAEITIKQGDLINFSTTLNEPYWPASDLHPTHGIYPEFDPQEPIDPQNSWTFQFLKPGKWKFHDHLQPFYRGVINIKNDEEN